MSKSNLEQLLSQHRIRLTPEFEGGWHAEKYGDEADAVAKGYGPTPSGAIEALLAAEGHSANIPHETAVATRAVSKTPQVPQNIIELIQRYGDQRSDNDLGCASTLGETITAIRALLATPAV